MAAEVEDTKLCDLCGATVYPEHLESNAAERIGGKLLCPHCATERRKKIPSGATVAPTPVAVHAAAHLRRPLAPESPHATRCRTFHCKLAEGALSYLNDQINEWVDANDDVRIKFANTTVGVVEGKHNDPHLIITIFY